jgi:diguanylate cyclase (GGDEF)-like protein/PAS domain S-box-containing protein
VPSSNLLGSSSVEDLDIEQLRTAFGLQSAILEAAADGIIAIDEKGRIKLFNSGAEKLFCYPAEEVLERNISCLMPEGYASRHDGYMSNYHNSGHAKIIGIGRDVEGLKSTGVVFPMHLSVGRADTPVGRLYIGICHDLTDYKNALSKLHIAEQRYREIVESQTELIIRLDSALRLTFINPAMGRLFRAESTERLLGMSFLDLIHNDDRILVKRLFDKLGGQTEQDVRTLLTRMSPCGGSTRWVEWRVRQLQEGEPLGAWEFQGFGVDVTDQMLAKEQIAYMAAHDSLTGLLNRQGFTDELSGRLTNEDYRCGIILLNLDCFDIINETHSHTAGDIALKMAADRIYHSLAKGDLCARLNADEFIVLLDGTDRPEDLGAVSHRLQSRLSEPYYIEQQNYNLTACAGISICPDNGATSESLMRRAQAALREAKSRGRHEMMFFNEDLEERTKSAAELELGIHQALENDLFKLVYQPKIDLVSNRLQGLEALIRWSHPEWGAVSPARFIPFAETNGLIVRIGQWVFENACKQWREWVDAGLDVPQIAVNISTRQLESWGFKEVMMSTLQTYSVPVSAIELEITEGAALNHTDEQMQLILALYAEGFSIAIDDFGTGYSSLSQLSSLPASTLKIDRAFVSKILPDTVSEPVIEAIIALGHSLNMKVVAEGVENQAQHEFLRERGCDVAQGYWYSRPLAPESVKSILIANAEKV